MPDSAPESRPESRWFHLRMADDLAGPNAFVTTRVGAVPLVAQNIKGRVVAFRNVCTHRFAVIHGEPAGCGPLRCPDHGWSFDADGVPVGLPFNPTDFQLEAEGRRRLALHPASLARCGPLRPAGLRPGGDRRGPSLEEELGSLFARLAALSDAFPRRGEALDRGTIGSASRPPTCASIWHRTACLCCTAPPRPAPISASPAP